MSVNMLLISGAVKAGTSKTGKKIITAIASCLVIIVFFIDCIYYKCAQYFS